MITESIEVENLKYGGCASTIKTRLQNLTGVFSVSVDKDNSIINIEHNSSINRKNIISQLESLGYPESHTQNTLLP